MCCRGEIKSAFCIFNLGKKGKAAMKKYIAEAGLQEHTEAGKLLKLIFKTDGAPSGGDEDPPDDNI